MPEWSDFRVLLALARAGSVAGAARELQVDGSTVSRRLAALENAAGARLLIRGGRDFTWTVEGRTLLAAGEAMEAAVNQALLGVRMAKTDLAGTVRVSVVPALVPLLMRLLLPEVNAAHPSLKVELIGAYESVDLAKGEADVAVRMTRPDQPDLVGRKIFEVGWCIFAAASYLKAHGRPETFDELPRHKLVLYAESMHDIPALKWMEMHRGAAQNVSRVDNVEIACQSIAAGGGIAVLPGFIGDAEPGLVRVFQSPVAINAGWIVYHEAARDSARVRVTADALIGFFKAHNQMFSGTARNDTYLAPD